MTSLRAVAALAAAGLALVAGLTWPGPGAGSLAPTGAETGAEQPVATASPSLGPVGKPAAPSNTDIVRVWARPEEALIRPGALFEFERDGAIGGCTMAFVLESASDVYVLTAGHCLDNPTPLIWAPTGPFENRTRVLIGETVFRANNSTVDVGLVRLLPEVWNRTSPMTTHWTGPTGIAHEGDVAYGDTVCHHGWGGVFRVNESLQPRCGRFGEFFVSLVRFSGWADGGDSGSPILAHDTGLAIGVAVRVLGTAGAPSVEVHGTSICAALGLLENEGFVGLRLVTAEYEPNMALLNVPLPTPLALYPDENHLPSSCLA